MKQELIYESLSSYRAPEMMLTEISVENGFATSGETEWTIENTPLDYGEGVTGF